MNEYKSDIIATRVGCLGGSDAKLIQGIAIANKIPQSAMKRLAVCKGLAEHQQFSNPAIEFGNYIESMVFDSLHSQDARWQSNPCLVSTKYSRPNCKVIDHIDAYLQDDDKRVVTIVEMKATRGNYAQTYDEYKWQLFHHYVLGCEKAKELGGYKVKVMLCHYCSDGIDLTQPFEFDPSRLTVKTLRNMEKLSKSYHLAEAMDLIDTFLEDFNEYYEDGEEIPYEILPEKVKTEFDQVTTFLTEIKEREKKVEDFKKKLCSFMQEKGVKAIKTDAWSITLVNESESVSVDYKAIFANEIEAKKPRVANKLRKQYKKVTKRKSYITIKVRDKNNE